MIVRTRVGRRDVADSFIAVIVHSSSSIHNDFSLSLSLSYRRVCFRAEMNRTRGSSHGGWVKKKREKKEEVEGNKRDLKNNIRRKWIQTR